MILNWIGEDNCSTLALEDLSARFRTSQLVGKIANIGDDSGADLLQNTAIFKKIVTGDSLTVEFKHGQPFNFSNKAKMLFSANNLPPSSDKSDGFFRRIVIIPFSAKFTPQTPGYDPNIIEKITTEEARSYLLNLALNGAIRLLKNGEFDVPEEVENLTRLYEINNNTVLQWLAAVKRPIENSVDQVIYTEYCLYCQSTNSIPVKLTKFNDEIKKVRPTLDLVYEETPDGTCHMVWKKTTDENQ
jgi:putative DNA primase/helicase